MSLLTDQILATGVSLNDLIHIVITGDTSQNPAGSSYKATISQVVATITGSTGTSGTSGSSGISGSNGSSGTSGVSGSNGVSGSSGTSGVSGTDGLNGTSGTSGVSGSNGVSGSSGTSGISGSDGSNCLRWVYNNPSNSGEFGMNSNVYGSVTQITINIVDTNSVDVTNWLTGITIGDTLTISSLSLPSNFGIYQVTSIPIVILNVVAINVTPIMSNGSTTNNILNTICYVRNGVNGTNGSNGSSGTSGVSGADGSNGSSGTSGISGIDGSSGTSGVSGSNGVSGSSGTSGISGSDGLNGSSGTSGVSGIDGALSARWLFNSTYTPPSVPVTASGNFYTDSTTIGSITEFVLDSFDEDGSDYSLMLYKLSVSPGVIVSITDVLNNSIFGTWDIQTINYTPNSTRFVVNNTFGSNGVLNPTSSYSISFSINGANGTSGTSGSSGTTGSSGSSGTAGSNGSSGSSGSAGTSGTSPVSPYPYVYGLFSQTGTSSVISGTTSELSIIGAGKGTLSVPANGFTQGDSFSIKLYGDIGSRTNDTLTIQIKSGSVILATTGAMTMPGITNSHFNLDVGFTIRATGSTGNAIILSSGFFTFIGNASSDYSAVGFTTINNTTFDTTNPNTLDITAQFNSTNSSNFIYSEFFVLNKMY